MITLIAVSRLIQWKPKFETKKKGTTMNPLTQFKKSGILVVTLIALCYSAAASGTSESASEVREFGPWSAPINVGPPLNTQYNDMYAVLTADGLTVYFTSDRPGTVGGNDLWVSRRESTEAPWGEPENLAILNTTSDDSLPVLSTSENFMYFHSDRPGGCGAGDLWRSQRNPVSGEWTAPVNMGCVVNTTATETAPSFYANDDLGLTTIYFGSNRPGGIGDFDIYETTSTNEDLESAVFGPGVLVPELSSLGRDTRTFVRRDGREIFITSNRTGGVGGLDIWVATREDSSDRWSTPVNPGPPLNSAADDGSPALSRDGRTLYFFSTRPGGFGGRDIWFTTRE
jgi:WD40-like Beta Propeller Repeat